MYVIDKKRICILPMPRSVSDSSQVCSHEFPSAFATKKASRLPHCQRNRPANIYKKIRYIQLSKFIRLSAKKYVQSWGSFRRPKPCTALPGEACSSWGPHRRVSSNWYLAPGNSYLRRILPSAAYIQCAAYNYVSIKVDTQFTYVL